MLQHTQQPHCQAALPPKIVPNGDVGVHCESVCGSCVVTSLIMVDNVSLQAVCCRRRRQPHRLNLALRWLSLA